MSVSLETQDNLCWGCHHFMKLIFWMWFEGAFLSVFKFETRTLKQKSKMVKN